MKHIISYTLLALLILPTLLVAQPDKVYTSLSEVTNPADVYILRLNHQRLKAIPYQIFSFSNLRVLDLSKNRIRHLPPQIGSLTLLEELNLDRNRLDTLPNELGRLDHLVRLNLSRNPLLDLPDSLARLSHLEELRIWSTGIISFPPSFAALNYSLKVIDMRACPLSYDNQESIEAILPTPQKKWYRKCNCQ